MTPALVCVAQMSRTAAEHLRAGAHFPRPKISKQLSRRIRTVRTGWNSARPPVWISASHIAVASASRILQV